MIQANHKRSLGLIATVTLLSGSLSAQGIFDEFEGDNFEDRFGHSAAAAGDVNNDGTPDYITGALQLGVGTGYARVFSGIDGSILYTVTAPDLAPESFANAVGGGADVNMDGHDDFVVATFAYSTSAKGHVRVYSGIDGSVLYTFAGDQDRDTFGKSCTILEDVNGDGHGDILVGANQQLMNGPGYIRVHSGFDGSILYDIVNNEGHLFGQDVDALGDIDGDGATDFAVGHPNQFSGVGSVRVLSGATGSELFRGYANGINDQFAFKVALAGDVDGDGVNDFMASQGGSDLIKNYVKVFSGADGSTLHTITSEFPGDRDFGSDICTAGDVDGDGFDDVAISSKSLPIAEEGFVRIYSGRTAAVLMDHRAGHYLDNIGTSLAYVGDLDGDGLGEIAAGSGYTCCGTGYPNGFLRVLSPCPLLSEAYCVAKDNSLGCSPAIGWTGMPTLTGPDDFVITATDVLNQKNGLLFYGYAMNEVPFLGGTLCVAAPILRTNVQASGGNPPPSDCSGSYGFAFTQARMVADGLSPGTSIFAQYWTRDPSHPDLTGVGLSNAIRFTICD